MSCISLMASSSTTPIMLSPSKKRVLDSNTLHTPNQTLSPPTRNELWRWCLRADAVASCYIRDVFELKGTENEDSKEQNAFWWLGTVPCRSVKFVGFLVGAMVYERRTMYTVDDGTGVIQCIHTHPAPTRPQDKKKLKTQSTLPTASHSSPTETPDLPKPAYEIGDTIRITGRVEKWHDSRQIFITDIELCRPNEEPEHWIATAKLHGSYYKQPFIIPPLPPPPAPRTPVKSAVTSTFTTPSTASAISTPSTAVSVSTPSAAPHGGPTRLRHPSRLRSKELIASTFKIYLKNYMDVLSDPSHDVLSQYDNYTSSVTSYQESPSKRAKRFHCLDHDDTATPKPEEKLRSPHQDSDATPRASYRKEKQKAIESRPKGFTLSYLRRVPELSDMAYRVVEAERKRRVREARQKQKEGARIAKTANVPNGKVAKPTNEEPTNRKMKRLYTWALRELHKEGSIVLHEDHAPVWEFSGTATHTRGVWKTKSADDSTATADSTTLSNLTNITIATVDDEDSGELSDPPIHEESYLPLTPRMLMDPIMEAIRNMMMRKPNPKPRQGPGSHRGAGTKVSGPTAEGLREYMGVMDARWENVCEYTIADALELLKAEDRVYRVGLGRWEPLL